MPFTFSHAAAAVPLARLLRLPLSALVVGSMSPDIIYFIELEATGNVGHTLSGLFAFCLPMSLAVLLLWHRIIKRPAAALLPHRLQQRLVPVLTHAGNMQAWRPLLRTMAAVLLGAVTHLVWDAFTHADGWVALRVPLLQQQVPFPGFGSMPLYKLAQLLSSAIGGGLLVWWVWQWVRETPVAHGTPVRPLRHRLRWLLGMPAAAVATAVAYSRWHHAPLADYPSIREFVVQTIVVGISALGLQLLAFALWYRLRQQKAGPARPASAAIPGPDALTSDRVRPRRPHSERH